MALRHRSRVRELERTAAELAALRDKRARIEVKIASMEAMRKTGLVEVVSESVGGLDLSQVPVEQVLARLTALDEVQPDGDDTALTEEDVDLPEAGNEEYVETFAKISRNTTIGKRAILERSGLHWNGRAGGWAGTVGNAALARLRLVFKERVTTPAMIDAGAPPLLPGESGAALLRAAEAPDTAPGEPDAGECRTDEGKPAEQVALKTTLFRGLPAPRPPPSLNEPANPA